MQEPERSEPKISQRKWKSFQKASKMRRMVILLWPHAQNHKGLLFVGALLSAMLIALRLAQPWPLKWVVDMLSNKHVSLSWFHVQSEHAIAIFSLLYVGVSLLAGFIDYWQQLFLAGLGNRIIFKFRNQLFAHLLQLPLFFHEKKTVGELVTRIVSDTARLRRGVNGILIRTFQVIFTFLASVIVIVQLDWRMATILGICGTLALLLMSGTGRKILSASRKNRKREGQLAAIVAEDVHGIRELQTFKPEHLNDERFEQRNVKSLRDEQKVRRLEASLLIRMETLLTISICVILWMGATAVQKGELSLGSLVLFIHYTVGLYGPFRQFARQAAQTGRTMACVDRLTNIMDNEVTISNAPDAVQLEKPPRVIRFSEVFFKSSRTHRTTKKWLLHDITFEISAGERIAIIGKNGAGKSTLLKLLLRLADPDEGCIRFDGQDIKKLKLGSLRNQISVVFQDAIFLGLTVRENITLGRPDATIEQIQQVVAQCGIDQWIASLKHGYDTPVRRQGTLFSGGERQKIALARALLRDGSIWLLDEPTNDLDKASRDSLSKLLVEVTNNRTTFWVTHDNEILQYCSRVIFLEEGKAGFIGTPGEYQAWSEQQNTEINNSKNENYSVMTKGER